MHFIWRILTIRSFENNWEQWRSSTSTRVRVYGKLHHKHPTIIHKNSYLLLNFDSSQRNHNVFELQMENYSRTHSRIPQTLPIFVLGNNIIDRTPHLTLALTFYGNYNSKISLSDIKCIIKETNFFNIIYTTVSSHVFVVTMQLISLNNRKLFDKIISFDFFQMHPIH